MISISYPCLNNILSYVIRIQKPTQLRSSNFITVTIGDRNGLASYQSYGKVGKNTIWETVRG